MKFIDKNPGPGLGSTRPVGGAEAMALRANSAGMAHNTAIFDIANIFGCDSIDLRNRKDNRFKSDRPFAGRLLVGAQKTASLVESGIALPFAMRHQEH